MRYEHAGRREFVEVVWERMRRGVLGQARPQPFGDLPDAPAFTQALLRDGFAERGPAEVWDFEPNPDLEERVWQAPEDRAAWLTYADWLEAKGQLALAELMRTSTRKPADNALGYALLGDLHAWMRDFNDDWRVRGLPRELQCASDRRHRELEAILHWPLCRFLERLDLCFQDHAPTVPVLLRWPGLARLRALSLWMLNEHEGDDAPDGHRHVSLGPELPDLSSVWPHTPQLRALALVGPSSGNPLGHLVLPQLEHLARRSRRLTPPELEGLWSAQCLGLRNLTIGVGRLRRDDELIAPEAFAPLLEGRLFPRLTRLAIEQYDAIDGLIERLAESPLLPRLTHLSLYQSALTGRGGEALAKHARAFAHLQTLNVRETTLTQDEGAALYQALPVVKAHNAFLAPDEEPYLFANYQTRFWEPKD